MLVLKVFCFVSASLAARQLDCGVLQVGVPKNGCMHTFGAAPTEEKEDDADNDSDRQDEVETFTNGVLPKIAACMRWGCADGMGVELANVEISGHCMQTLFSFLHPGKLCIAMLQGILFMHYSCYMNLLCLRLALWFALTS